MEFGASDLGGPKQTGPTETLGTDEKLINERIRKKEFSRWFAVGVLITLGLSAIASLAFSFYIACHFIGGLDDAAKAKTQAIESSAQPTQNKIVADKQPDKAEEKPNSTSQESTAKFYIHVFAPLIPATFSTAIALILFITIARFVTNFERARDDDNSKPEDYGAIAVLFEQISKFIKTLKSK